MKLSDNAETVLQKRYYINGEDWDGLCWRVANAVGKDEASRKEYFDAINNLYFLPNSPTLMNAGTELNNLSACFKEDAMVSVENGVKEISKIHIGDKVITHKGRYRNVTEVFERDYMGDMLRINVVGCIKNRFISTPEHPIYAIKYNDILCKRHLSSKANMVCNHSKKYCKKLERQYKDDCDGVEVNPDWIAAKDLVVGDYVSISALNSEYGANVIDSNAKQFLWNDGKLFRRISEIKTETFSGIVYNLEVEDDHSYSVNGIDVHNCFVLPLDDSMDSIMDCAKSMAKVFKSGGGCGISLDKLREKDSSVGSTSGAASGVVSFMQLYDTVANTVKQGGKRRAAIISSLRVDHPEILDFIDCKTDLKKFNNMNISVAITDKFMKAVENNQDYDLVSPVNGVVGKLNAREVFMKIATNAHQSGEPGLIFLDTANKLNPIPQFGKYATTNPCGEIFLLPNEACNLLSLNLNKINDDNIDYYVRLSVRFLNDVIDCGKYPLPEIQEQVSLTRKIGLGIMGWADLLASKMIPYDSPKARHLADSLSRQIHEIAHDESVMLAIKNNKYIETTEGKRYNGTLLTIAPTGTISMIADVSSSIEPYFALCYTKNVMDGHSLKYVNPILQSTLEKEGLWCSEVKAQIAKTGSIQNIDTIPQSIKDVFKTANEISVGGHVKMQAAFQKNIDNSISKSINLPNSATVEDVLHAYGLAYNLGVKGITVYRDGSRNNQVLTSPKSRIERCPECSSKEISHESGCVACRNCGWSKCSI